VHPLFPSPVFPPLTLPSGSSQPMLCHTPPHNPSIGFLLFFRPVPGPHPRISPLISSSDGRDPNPPLYFGLPFFPYDDLAFLSSRLLRFDNCWFILSPGLKEHLKAAGLSNGCWRRTLFPSLYLFFLPSPRLVPPLSQCFQYRFLNSLNNFNWVCGFRAFTI